MTGPDDVKVPELSGSTGLGKDYNDLTDDLKFVKAGDTIKATGNLKTISKWEGFDASGNNTGHFLPIKLPEKCSGKEVTCKGRKDGDRKVKIDPDLMLIVRLENLESTIFTLEMGGETIAKIDVSDLIPVGEAAYNAEKTSFGRYGDKTKMTQDFSITWDGPNGTAKGTLVYMDDAALTPYQNLSTPGCYLPIAMSDWYAEGVNKKAGIKTIKDETAQDIVFIVADNTTPVTVTYNGKSVMNIDLTGVTVQPTKVRTKVKVDAKAPAKAKPAAKKTQ